jgi:hypothetical protein
VDNFPQGIAMLEQNNTGEIVDEQVASAPKEYHEPSDAEKELLAFILDHTDKWREYRDQNYMEDWQKYERVFRGQWQDTDKTRTSERSRVISPATQQAVETRHAEIMEAIFGQGEYFDIQDDLMDQNGKVDVEKLKNQLKEDFSQDKIRKAFDQIALMAEIYGTGIGEIIVTSQKQYKPMTVAMDSQQNAYGVGESERISVKLNPVNPKNFLFDPNGTEVDDCMGVAIEKYVSIHKIAQGIASGKYMKVDLSPLYKDDSQEPTQETTNYKDDKVLVLTYYGLVPREYLKKDGEEYEDLLGEDDSATEDYSDLVEAIIVVANGGMILKMEESPYMMKDRPILTYQADTVPLRLLGRGTVEKSINMQSAIDGSMRSHMDALALTVAPMMGMDASRLPRGAKFEVKPGASYLVNGNPAEILMPFKFGTNDGQAMQTSKEFERMLTMATGTIDSNGTITQVGRDSNMDMATATMIKKYKRVLVNFQEDFLIPFIYKSAWRYMQFDPKRYPSLDVKFIPTATLGIIAREYEQKQLAFLIQTLGAQSPLTPVLMNGILANSSLSNKAEMLEQMTKMSQPDPQAKQMQDQHMQMEMGAKQADIEKTKAETELTLVKAKLAPSETQAKVVAALSNNLNEDNEGDDFERRARIAELMLKEKDIESNHDIARMQMSAKKVE